MSKHLRYKQIEKAYGNDAYALVMGIHRFTKDKLRSKDSRRELSNIVKDLQKRNFLLESQWFTNLEYPSAHVGLMLDDYGPYLYAIMPEYPGLLATGNDKNELLADLTTCIHLWKDTKEDK